MSIYTRGGDAGTTSLADGSRVSKDCPRIEAYGTVDEANSAIGVARAGVNDDYLDGVLHFMQQRLMNCGSSLATPPEHASERTPRISEDDIAFLESAIDTMMEASGPLTHFIIPAGGETAARLQLARAVMRRAERRLVELAAAEATDPLVQRFVNRSSDALFAAARYSVFLGESAEEAWDPAYPRP